MRGEGEVSWYSDNSRFVAGFECPWRRLIRYHLGGTGFTFATTPDEIRIGLSIHSNIESIYKAAQAGEELPTVLSAEPIVMGLVAAYKRVVVPWILESFEILAVEEEYSLDFGDGLIWMARPDLTLRHRETGLVWLVDYKSSSSQPERIAAIHLASLQTLMNGYAVSTRWGQLGGAQIHVLNRGSEKYPSFLTHAFRRPANAYYQEDWQPKAKDSKGRWIGKLYKLDEVSKYRNINDWVNEIDPDILSSAVPISAEAITAPEIQGRKILQGIASIQKNEAYWRELISSIDWKTATIEDLDKLVPRTFHCVQYNRRCEYEYLCFKRSVQEHSASPSTIVAGFEMVPRQPHHPQEGTFDD